MRLVGTRAYEPPSPAKIRAVRRRMRLDEANIARLIGVSEVSFKRWERGKNEPTGLHIAVLELMEKALAWTADDHAKVYLAMDDCSGDIQQLIWELQGFGGEIPPKPQPIRPPQIERRSPRYPCKGCGIPVRLKYLGKNDRLCTECRRARRDRQQVQQQAAAAP